MKCKRGSHFIHLIKANADKLELRRADALPSSKPSSLVGVTFLPRRFRYSHRARVVVSISLCLMCVYMDTQAVHREETTGGSHTDRLLRLPGNCCHINCRREQCVKTNLLSGDWSNQKTTKLYLKKNPKKSSIKKQIWKNYFRVRLGRKQQDHMFNTQLGVNRFLITAIKCLCFLNNFSLTHFTDKAAPWDITTGTICSSN